MCWSLFFDFMSVCLWDGWCAGRPVCPGVHRLRPRRGGPPFCSSGLFMLLTSARWDEELVRDDLRGYVAAALGIPAGY